MRRPGCADAALVIGKLCSVFALDQETVNHFRFAADQTGFIIIEKLIAHHPDHQRTDGQRLHQENDPPCAVLFNTDPDRNGIDLHYDERCEDKRHVKCDLLKKAV